MLMNDTGTLVISPAMLTVLCTLGAVLGSICAVLLNHWLTGKSEKYKSVKQALIEKADKKDVDEKIEAMEKSLTNFKTRIGNEMDSLREQLTISNKGIEKITKMLIYMITKSGGELKDIHGLMGDDQ